MRAGPGCGRGRLTAGATDRGDRDDAGLAAGPGLPAGPGLTVWMVGMTPAANGGLGDLA